MTRKRTIKEIDYFRSLQTNMLKHRSYFLHGAANQDMAYRSVSRTRLDQRRYNGTSKKNDKERHIAASLQHDLWS